MPPHSFSTATTHRFIEFFVCRVLGWAFSSKPDADLVIKALDMAYEQRGQRAGASCGRGKT
ncbi:hypothetical protein GPJ81_04630 [Pseudomonas alkylphenolica]|uniref:Uncharacterized protein n=1 Tax=Pseudomonas alkylphenolica TaxID=237609 RepID=A0A6I6GNP1_9PSED|nr:hypothetical protein GPJ81_04630 [Pseudomonas alkylphenolica]